MLLQTQLMSRYLFLGTLVAFPASAGAQTTLTFRQGAGYAGCVDTSLYSDFPDDPHGTDDRVAIDHDAVKHGLIRFEQIFGNASGQIPLGTSILSATLHLKVPNPGQISTTFHRMLIPWNENDTWNSLGAGIQTDGVEAEIGFDGFVPTTLVSTLAVDLTSSLQAWSDGAANYGWALIPGSQSNDGWEFASANHADENQRPLLEVTFDADCNSNGIPDPQDINHDCCDTGDGAGCSYAPIESCVCAADRYCCLVEWDEVCVERVASGECGPCDIDCNSNAVPDECDIADGVSQDCQPDGIPDECQTDGPYATLSFRQGTQGADTSLYSELPANSFCNDGRVAIDFSLIKHGLIRFESIFGSAPGQIPLGATIIDATLRLDIPNQGQISTTLHRILVPWQGCESWDDWGSGVQTDDMEAKAGHDALIPSTLFPSLSVPVTASLQAWADGAANHGWVLIPGGESADGWEFTSGEDSSMEKRPLLQVTFAINNDCDTNGVPDECDPDFDADGQIDACDPDIDNDGVANDLDACDNTPMGRAVDAVGHPLGDIDRDCDTDMEDYALFLSGFTGPLP